MRAALITIVQMYKKSSEIATYTINKCGCCTRNGPFPSTLTEKMPFSLLSNGGSLLSNSKSHKIKSVEFFEVKTASLTLEVGFR